MSPNNIMVLAEVAADFHREMAALEPHEQAHVAAILSALVLSNWPASQRSRIFQLAIDDAVAVLERAGEQT